MENRKNVEDLVNMISEGKTLEAFDKYYDDKVVMQENDNEARVGKEVNRKYEEDFVNGIEKMHDSKILGYATNGDYATIESFMDLTHKEWGHVSMSEVSVQHWKNGKIISEKFYFDPKK